MTKNLKYTIAISSGALAFSLTVTTCALIRAGFCMRLEPQVAAVKSSQEPATEFDCPPIYTVFTYDIISRVTHRNNQFKILSKQDDFCVMRSSSYGEYAWASGIAPYHTENDQLSANLAKQLWPLRVGNHAETQTSSYRIDFDVVSYGPVEVPLGTFEAYKITKSYWHREYRFISTMWWSPKFKWVIKQEERSVFGPPPIAINNWALANVSSM